MLGIALFAWVVTAPDQRGAIRTDVLATMLYVANWHQIFSGQSYFALTTSSSPLIHTWTLAIEEQFYLVWPLVVLGVLHLTGRLRSLLVVTVTLALASAVWMAVLYPYVDQNRLYYGTDTRAQDVLVGAALAIALAMRAPSMTDRGRRLMAALAGLATVGLAIEWIILPTHPWLPYRGGFLLSDVLFALLILGLVLAPALGLARLLNLRPLVYLGTISYSLYLWHWPVDLYLNTARTGLSGWQLFGVRSVVAGVIAAGSTHWIENPIRLGTFQPWRNWAWTATPAAVLVAAGAVLIATVAPSAASGLSAASGTTTTPNSTGISGPPASGPTKFLLLGNSQALTLGSGLSADTGYWNVRLNDQGQDGCAYEEGIQSHPPVETRVDGTVGVANAGCVGWPATWAKLVKSERPPVVGLVMGRWELYDYLYKGHWTHVGEAGWDAHLLYAMNLAVKILSAHGAAVILFTTPYCSPLAGDDPNGIVLPENQPSRADAYNELVRKVAAEHPGVVSVYDLNKEFTVKKDVYTPTIGGVDMRTSDGIHFTTAAGELVGNHLFPLVRQLALSRSH
jgi:peptidoglycan/LPS O-acetylase OafA/YrhL